MYLRGLNVIEELVTEVPPPPPHVLCGNTSTRGCLACLNTSDAPPRAIHAHQTLESTTHRVLVNAIRTATLRLPSRPLSPARCVLLSPPPSQHETRQSATAPPTWPWPHRASFARRIYRLQRLTYAITPAARPRTHPKCTHDVPSHLFVRAVGQSAPPSLAYKRRCCPMPDARPSPREEHHAVQSGLRVLTDERMHSRTTIHDLPAANQGKPRWMQSVSWSVGWSGVGAGVGVGLGGCMHMRCVRTAV
ncbi:hypothetical protein MSAN_00096800 [Mycena sanguinolenta]|uniref:Uncharacterized protein n=1 Tax=Mycena sanguinolenta TaxID=230812 RepID=A0A8H7DIN0_9AGAR|nr:hypothetical protein MSAN_00096800 [Mycena sanguinolenta]